VIDIFIETMVAEMEIAIVYCRMYELT